MGGNVCTLPSLFSERNRNSLNRKSGFMAYHSFACFFFLIFLFLAVLGLRCCAQAFSSCSEWGLLFVVVRRLLIAVASLLAEHGL